MDERGQTIFGASPRRSVFAGQLLPRFDITGTQDETSDIKIAAVGMDLVIGTGANARFRIVPQFSVYVRVIPQWRDLVGGGGELEFDFRLQKAIQKQIDDRIRTERTSALQAAGVARPDWKSLDETKRAKIRAQRAEILTEVRTKAYAAFGIKLIADEVSSDTADPTVVTDDVTADPNTPDDAAPAPAPIARLVRENREIPPHLVDPAPIPGKWRRLDLSLPVLEFDSDSDDASLEATLGAYNASLAQAAAAQLENWAAGDGATEGWRDVKVKPVDTLDETRWTTAMAAIASRPLDRNRVVPELSQVLVKVERQADFLDASRLSMRVMLDNQSSEPHPQDAQGRCNTLFGASLSLALPKAAHRPLKLDRVEPSYRFRDYLEYPAIGLNCGVDAEEFDNALRLCTTIAPRFAQPRIVARNIGLPHRFAILGNPGFDATKLLDLPETYLKWVDEQESRLKEAVVAGLDEADAKIERSRFAKDMEAQRAEARYIARGIEVLIASKEAFDKLAGKQSGDSDALERLAAPWRAWTMTNEAFALRDAHDPDRGWRLFQMAFVLARLRRLCQSPAQCPVTLEIPLAAHGLFTARQFLGIEERPRPPAGRSRALAGIVFGKPALEIEGPPDIGPVTVRGVAAENVDECRHGPCVRPPRCPLR